MKIVGKPSSSGGARVGDVAFDPRAQLGARERLAVLRDIAADPDRERFAARRRQRLGRRREQRLRHRIAVTLRVGAAPRHRGGHRVRVARQRDHACARCGPWRLVLPSASVSFLSSARQNGHSKSTNSTIVTHAGAAVPSITDGGAFAGMSRMPACVHRPSASTTSASAGTTRHCARHVGGSVAPPASDGDRARRSPAGSATMQSLHHAPITNAWSAIESDRRSPPPIAASAMRKARARDERERDHRGEVRDADHRQRDPERMRPRRRAHGRAAALGAERRHRAEVVDEARDERAEPDHRGGECDEPQDALTHGSGMNLPRRHRNSVAISRPRDDVRGLCEARATSYCFVPVKPVVNLSSAPTSTAWFVPSTWPANRHAPE